MIVKNYKFLYTLTTAVFSFLPITIMSVHAKSGDSRIPCNDTEGSYICRDGKKHTIKGRDYYLKSVQDYSHKYSQSSIPIASVYVEKEGTVINASQVRFLDNMSGKKTSYDAYSAYGAYVAENGKLDLTDSVFKNIPALRAQNGAIKVTDGKIGGISHAIYASGKKADIALVRVNVDIVSGDVNTKGMAIVSELGAMVRMSGSSVTFNETGAFTTQLGGEYLLDAMDIKGKGKKYTVVVDDESIDRLPEAFNVSQGGKVHLRNNSIQLTDMHGFLITNFSGLANKSGKLIQEYDSSDEFKKTSIKIDDANILVHGKEVYGLYFDVLDAKVWANMLDIEDEKRFKTEIIMGTASVSLLRTTFAVPDGIAIYSTGPDGYGAKATLELSEGTKISGDLLLKAEHDSFITVKANNSTLTGGIRTEDFSTVNLELMHSSTWYLTQSKDKGLEEENSTDSVLSSVSITDSTIIFKAISNNYQTLRIGKETDILERNMDKTEENEFYRSQSPVYLAEGNSRIHLRAFLNDDGSFDTQKIDRVLIYGNASGNTLIQMEDLPKNSKKKVSNGKDQSVSIIQVAGYAHESSFQLIGNYATINSFPYQYHLRGYGPGSSLGDADPQNRLLAGKGDFWDFRLESIYISPKDDSSETETVSTDLTATSSMPSSPNEPSSSGEVPLSVSDVPSMPSSDEPSMPSSDEPSAPSSTPADSTSASFPSDDPVEISSMKPTFEASVPIKPSLPDSILTPASSVESSSVTPEPELPIPSSSPPLPLSEPSVPFTSDGSTSSSVPLTPATPSSSKPSSSEDPTFEASTPSPVAPSEPVDLQPTDPTPPSSIPISPTPSPAPELPVPSAPSTPIPPASSSAAPSDSVAPAPVPELPVPLSPVELSSSETSVPSSSEDPTSEASTPSPVAPSEPVDLQSADPTPPSSISVSPTPSPVAPVPVKPDIQT
ncbi:autotransporter outer membrane beta-barrel domain-containing protein, partial [Bartonella sp. 220]|uniref:autotransporter outer membrane beta-barrel domain-containing protein n=1 Tax=Bartonella sp. 220B TaxID=2967260 RepID=UPI0022A92BD6